MYNRIIFGPGILEFIEKTSNCNRISLLLINGNFDNLLNHEGNYVDRDLSSDDGITYLPVSKYEKIEVDPFNDKGIGRTSIRIGRFIRKFIKKEAFKRFDITDKDVESFVNIYKSFFIRKPENLKIVTGKDILQWYLEDNYQVIHGNRFGTLWNSCMRYSDRNSYMKLYTKNSNIKMLILLTDEGKLSARALLWDNVVDNQGKSWKVMDRIYSVHDYDVNLFKDWAKENGYIFKWEQTAKSEGYFSIDGECIHKRFSIKLENYVMYNYPYLDTFKYFNLDLGILDNYPDKHQYVLIQSNGGLEPEHSEENEPEPEFYDDEN